MSLAASGTPRVQPANAQQSPQLQQAPQMQQSPAGTSPIDFATTAALSASQGRTPLAQEVAAIAVEVQVRSPATRGMAPDAQPTRPTVTSGVRPGRSRCPASRHSNSNRARFSRAAPRVAGPLWKRFAAAMRCASSTSSGVTSRTRTRTRRSSRSTIAISTGVSIGYVLWLVRSGVLLGSVLTSLPAWQTLDPLPVLDAFRRGGAGGDDDDEVERVFGRGDAPGGRFPSRNSCPEGTESREEDARRASISRWAAASLVLSMLHPRSLPRSSGPRARRRPLGPRCARRNDRGQRLRACSRARAARRAAQDLLEFVRQRNRDIVSIGLRDDAKASSWSTSASTPARWHVSSAEPSLGRATLHVPIWEGRAALGALRSSSSRRWALPRAGGRRVRSAREARRVPASPRFLSCFYFYLARDAAPPRSVARDPRPGARGARYARRRPARDRPEAATSCSRTKAFAEVVGTSRTSSSARRRQARLAAKRTARRSSRSALPWRRDARDGATQRNRYALSQRRGRQPAHVPRELHAGARRGREADAAVLVSLDDVTRARGEEGRAPRGEGAGRRGEPREERLPREHEPRDPHADERDPRLHRAPEARLRQERRATRASISTRSTRAASTCSS